MTRPINVTVNTNVSQNHNIDLGVLIDRGSVEEIKVTYVPGVLSGGSTGDYVPNSIISTIDLKINGMSMLGGAMPGGHLRYLMAKMYPGTTITAETWSVLWNARAGLPTKPALRQLTLHINTAAIATINDGDRTTLTGGYFVITIELNDRSGGSSMQWRIEWSVKAVGSSIGAQTHDVIIQGALFNVVTICDDNGTLSSAITTVDVTTGDGLPIANTYWSVLQDDWGKHIAGAAITGIALIKVRKVTNLLKFVWNITTATDVTLYNYIYRDFRLGR